MIELALVGPYPHGVYEQVVELLPKDWVVTRIETQQELDARTDLVYVILRTFKMNNTLIAANPKLRMIQRWGAGYDTVDIAAAGKQGIPVAVAAGINSLAVAEHTVMLMMASLRNLVPIAVDTASGKWDRNTYATRSYMISEKKVGLLGCGAIGKCVAGLLRGLGAEVFYYDPYRMDAEVEMQMQLTYLYIDELFSQSDIVSLHMPLTEETSGIVDKRRIGMMKPTAFLINTSRGGLIDESALADALEQKLLMGAALDSVSEEPYPIDGRLRQAPNLLITPHIAGTVAELNMHMARRVCENVIKVHENRPLSAKELVNREFFNYPVE